MTRIDKIQQDWIKYDKKVDLLGLVEEELRGVYENLRNGLYEVLNDLDFDLDLDDIEEEIGSEEWFKKYKEKNHPNKENLEEESQRKFAWLISDFLLNKINDAGLFEKHMEGHMDEKDYFVEGFEARLAELKGEEVAEETDIKKITNELKKINWEEYDEVENEEAAQAKVNELKQLVEAAAKEVKSWPDNVFDKEKYTFFEALSTTLKKNQEIFGQWKNNKKFFADSGYEKCREVVNIFAPKEEFKEKLDNVWKAAAESFIQQIQEAANKKKLDDKKIWSYWEEEDGGEYSKYKEYSDDNWKNNIRDRFGEPQGWEKIIESKKYWVDRTLEKIAEEKIVEEVEDGVLDIKIEEITFDEKKGISNFWERDNNRKALEWTPENCLSKKEKEGVLKYIKKQFDIFEDKVRDKWLEFYKDTKKDDWVEGEKKDEEEKTLEKKINEFEAYRVKKQKFLGVETGVILADPEGDLWGKSGKVLGSNALLEEGETLTTVRRKIVKAANKFIGLINEELGGLTTSRASAIVKNISQKLDLGELVGEAEKNQLTDILIERKYFKYLSEAFGPTDDKNYLRVAKLLFLLTEQPEIPRVNSEELEKYWGFEDNEENTYEKLKAWREGKTAKDIFSDSEVKVAAQHLELKIKTFPDTQIFKTAEGEREIKGHQDRVVEEFIKNYGEHFKANILDYNGWNKKDTQKLFEALIKRELDSVEQPLKLEGKTLSAEAKRKVVVRSTNEFLADLVGLDKLIRAENLLGGKEKTGLVSNDNDQLQVAFNEIRSVLDNEEGADNSNAYQNLLEIKSWCEVDSAKEAQKAEAKTEQKLSGRSSSASQVSSTNTTHKNRKNRANSSLFNIFKGKIRIKTEDKHLSFRAFIDSLEEQLQIQQEVNSGGLGENGKFLSVELWVKLNAINFEIKEPNSWDTIVKDLKKYIRRLIIINSDKRALEKVLTSDEAKKLGNEVAKRKGMTDEEKEKYIRTEFCENLIKRVDGELVWTGIEDPKLVKRIEEWMRKSNDFKDFGKEKIQRILSRAYTKDIAVERLFQHANQCVELLKMLVDLNEFEDYILVGEQKLTLEPMKKRKGANTEKVKRFQQEVGLVIKRQEWNGDVVDEVKLLSILKQFWAKTKEEKQEWDASWEDCVEKNLTFSRKEVMDWNRYLEELDGNPEGGIAADLDAKPTVFEGSRIQQIYLAKLALLRRKMREDNPNYTVLTEALLENTDENNNRTGGFGHIGKDYYNGSHARWIKELEDEIEKVKNLLQLGREAINDKTTKINELESFFKGSLFTEKLDLVDSKAWEEIKREDGRSEFSAAVENVTEQKNIRVENFTFVQWVKKFKEFMESKKGWINDRELDQKINKEPNIFKKLGDVENSTLEIYNENLIKEFIKGFEDAAIKDSNNKVIVVREGMSIYNTTKMLNHRNIDWADLFGYLAISAMGEISVQAEWGRNGLKEKKWTTLPVSGEGAYNAWKAGYVPSDLGFKINWKYELKNEVGRWEIDSDDDGVPKLTPVVIIKGQKVTDFSDGNEGRKGKRVNLNDVTWKDIGNKTIEKTEAKSPAVDLVSSIVELDWRKSPQNLADERKKLEEEIAELRGKLYSLPLTEDKVKKQTELEQEIKKLRDKINGSTGFKDSGCKEIKSTRRIWVKDPTGDVTKKVKVKNEETGKIEEITIRGKLEDEEITTKVQAEVGLEEQIKSLFVEIKQKLLNQKEKRATDERVKELEKEIEEEWKNIGEKEEDDWNADDREAGKKIKNKKIEIKRLKQEDRIAAEVRRLENWGEEVKKELKTKKNPTVLTEVAGGVHDWINELNHYIKEINGKVNELSKALIDIETKKDSSQDLIRKKLARKERELKKNQRRTRLGNKSAVIEEVVKAAVKNGGNFAVPNDRFPHSEKPGTSEELDKNSFEFRVLSKNYNDALEKDRAESAEKLTKLKDLSETYETIQGLDKWKKRGRSFLDFAASNRVIEERTVVEEKIDKFVTMEGDEEVEKTFKSEVEKKVKFYGKKKTIDEITTLQEWIDVEFWKLVEEEVEEFAFTGELRDKEFWELVRDNRKMLNEIIKRRDEINVDKINEERQRLWGKAKLPGDPPLLEGGKLDLRGYHNLSVLQIPVGSLTTPLTEVNISDCSKLGKINSQIKEYEAWIKFWKERNDGKDPLTGREKEIEDKDKEVNEKKITSLEEKLTELEEKKTTVWVETDLNKLKEAREKTGDYKWLEKFEQEKEAGLAREEEGRKKAEDCAYWEFYTNSEWAEDDELNVVESGWVNYNEKDDRKFTHLKNFLEWYFNDVERAKLTEINIAEINEKRVAKFAANKFTDDGETYTINKGGKEKKYKIRFTDRFQGVEWEVDEKGEKTGNIYLWDDMNLDKVERVFFDGNWWGVGDLTKKRSQKIFQWRTQVEFPEWEGYSSFQMAAWIESLEKGSNAAVGKTKITGGEKEKITEKDRKLTAEAWEWAWATHKELFPKIHNKAKGDGDGGENHAREYLESILWPTFVENLIIDIVNRTSDKEKFIMGPHALVECDIDIGKEYLYPEEDNKKRPVPGTITGNELVSRFNLQKTGRNSIQGLIELVGNTDSEMEKKLNSLVELRKVMLSAEELLFGQVPVTRKQAAEKNIDKNFKEVEFADWTVKCLDILEKLKVFQQDAGSLEEDDKLVWKEGDGLKNWAYKTYHYEQDSEDLTVDRICGQLVDKLIVDWTERIAEAETEEKLNGIDDEIKRVGLNEEKMEFKWENEIGEIKVEKFPSPKVMMEELIELRKIVIKAKEALNFEREKDIFGLVTETEEEFINRIKEKGLKKLNEYLKETKYQCKQSIKTIDESVVNEENKFSWVRESLIKKIAELELKSNFDEKVTEALADLGIAPTLEEQKDKLKSLKIVESICSLDKNPDATDKQQKVWTNDGVDIEKKITELELVVPEREEIDKKLKENPDDFNELVKLSDALMELKNEYEREEVEEAKKKAWELEKSKFNTKTEALEKSIEDKFIDDFGKATGNARAFASNLTNKDKVLKFLGIKENGDGKVWKVNGKFLGEFYNLGWTDEEKIVWTSETPGEKKLQTLYKGKLWDKRKFSEVEDEIWLEKFMGTNPLPFLSRETCLKYKEKNIPAEKARKAWDNGWLRADKLEWDNVNNRLTVSSYTSSHGLTDTDFDALNVSRSGLDKAHYLIMEIEGAHQVSILLGLEAHWGSHFEPMMVGNPAGRTSDEIKTKLETRKTQLETIQQVKDYHGSLDLNETIETICENDWKDKLSEKTGTELTNEAIRLKNLIAEFKVKPDIAEIEGELRKQPEVSVNELANSNYSNYRQIMLGLVADDTLRNSKKSAIIEEIKRLRREKDTDGPARENAITKILEHTISLGLGDVEIICGNDWRATIRSYSGPAIADYVRELKDKITRYKVQPDIDKITWELNQDPVVSLNFDYTVLMMNLAADDIQRDNKISSIIEEIKRLRREKIDQERREREEQERRGKIQSIQTLITSAQTVLNNSAATKEEVEKAIKELKDLVSATVDSVEKTVWEEKKTENEKLLTDLEAKLVKINARDPDKENPDDIPTPPPSPTPEEEIKEKFGEDYTELKPIQQEGRKTIVENWKKEVSYSRKKVCRYCPQEFQYDKSLEFFVAEKKVGDELVSHEATCEVKDKNSEEIKEIKQDNWEKTKKTTERYFYHCRKCWGKVELDKKESDWEEAKVQARADLAYHEEHECGQEGEKMIGIYFSPNQGGNGHAPLIYAEKIKEDELLLEKDNQGQIYQEQTQPEKPFSWTPWIIGGGILAVGGLLFTWLFKKYKKRTRE